MITGVLSTVYAVRQDKGAIFLWCSGLLAIAGAAALGILMFMRLAGYR